MGGQVLEVSKQQNLKPIATLSADQLPTKKDLRGAIPDRCFEHSVVRSLWLVIRDALVIGAIFHIGWNYLPMENSSFFSTTWFGQRIAWQLYWFLQGTALVGWWVLAHECGHRGFSNNMLLCDTVGWVLHSFLLVPYFSWQYSHGVHHAKTNHLLDGESHVPPHRKGFTRIYTAFFNACGEDAFAVYQLLSHLIFGWPMYLFLNVTGARRTTQGDRITTVHDHFRPWSKLFPAHGGWDIRVCLSTFGVCLTLFGLFLAGTHYGHTKVAWFYWPSYLWCNFWLVLYTWLQHTAPDMPHFGQDEWTWVRGGLCTIDRPYGIFDWMHHNIGSTHVAHHLFSRMPCYRAVEATAALKTYLEPKGLYHYDDTNFVAAAWNVALTCHFVDDLKGIQHYKSLRDTVKKSQ